MVRVLLNPSINYVKIGFFSSSVLQKKKKLEMHLLKNSFDKVLILFTDGT